jgi:HlyD family secretion protein
MTTTENSSISRLPNQSRCWAALRTRSLVLSAGVLLLGLSGCSKEKEAEPVVSVQAATVSKMKLQRVLTTEAVIFPLKQAAIVPKIVAPVKTFYVKRGGKVKKDQLLAVLENKDLAAAAEDNKGALAQAEAAYVTATASSLPEEVQKATLDTEAAKQMLDAEQKVYSSREELFKQGALPRKDLDQARVSLTQARNQYDLAERHLKALNAGVAQQAVKGAEGLLSSAKGKYLGAQAQLSYSEIRSPIDGVVTDRPLYPGEMPAAGVPLITVMDISQVIAKAHISQAEAASLKVGDEASITAPGQEEPIPGKVTLVSPALDPNSTTVEVWVQAKNPHSSLRPGSSVQLAIESQTVPDALVVPTSALLTGPDGATTVMVIGPDKRAHQQAVKVGLKQADKAQILEGVKEGDQVVATGAYGLPDNTKVNSEAVKEAEGEGKPDAAKPEAKSSDAKSDEKPAAK